MKALAEPAARAGNHGPGAMTGTMTGMRETALNFGPSGELVGILIRPRAGQERSPDLALLFLNAGIIHRIGPNRIHVRLARKLASLGVPSLRMDLPGIGDSRTIGTSASIPEANRQAIRSALDLLESRGVGGRFVLFGLCSGADDAFRVACVDPRVVGICLVDPPTLFATWKSVALRVLRWAARPRSWLRLLSGRYGLFRYARQAARPQRLANGSPGEGSRGEAGNPSREIRRLLGEALGSLVARRVRICHIITGDQGHVYNYRTQLLDTYPGIGLRELTRLELFPAAVHTFPHEASRVKLEETLADWIVTTPFSHPGTGLGKGVARPGDSRPAGTTQA